ncbi:MAG: septum formation protein Maf [Alphaproteobacteria bacterium]|nr:septum formation protein Maf [Alphaproteobacteria bacterium]
MTSPKAASPIASNKQIWLASASPRRRDLLASIGLEPAHVLAADIDETPLRGELPAALALRLAQSKAAKIAAQCDDDNMIVLAADTVVSVGRRILPKTETPDEARACLKLLSGRGHRVQTGIACICGDRQSSRVVRSRVRMKPLSEGDINAYLACGEWQGKAGGYAIQGRAAIFVTGLVGSYSNIVGLPLYETAQILTGLGVSLPDIISAGGGEQ